MAQQDGMQHLGDSSRSAEQPFSTDSPSASNVSRTLEGRMLDEDHHFRNNRKVSVISKVKEKAKKWRQTLSRKKHGHDNMPPGGFDDEIELESEHHGGSNVKPRMFVRSSIKSGKNNTKKSGSGSTLPKSYSDIQRGNPSILKFTMNDTFRAKSLDRSHGGRAPSPVNYKVEHIVTEKNASILREKLLHLQATRESEPEDIDEHSSDITPLTQDSIDESSTVEQKGKLPILETTTNETRSEESIVNDLNENLSSLRIPTGPEQEEKHTTTPQKSDHGEKQVSPTTTNTMTEVVTGSYGLTSEIQSMSMPSCNSENEERNYDGGFSVEFLKNKLEPGEDERALSQVISEVMSPKRAPREKGVAEKVRDVSVMLRSEASPSSSSMKKSESTSSIPVSSNAHEVEEDTQGRILQAN